MKQGQQCWPLHRTAVVLLAAMALALFGLSAGACGGGDRQGGSAPPLTSPQDVTAESGGVTLAVSGAEFSGTATFVELAARIAGADQNKVTRVSIPAKAFVSGNLAPADLTASIMLIANGPATIQRLRPVSAVGPVKMVISFVDVDDGQGTRRIAGDWVLELKPPADLARALRVETLSPGDPAEAQGVTVRPLSATRSTTETLVTVALEGPPGIEQLALPSLVGASVNGGPVFGPRIAGGAGEPVTFSFPPTDFGTPLEIQFTEFIASPAPGGSSTRWVDIRLDAVLSRQGVTGKRGERAAVDSGDIAAASGGGPVERNRPLVLRSQCQTDRLHDDRILPGCGRVLAYACRRHDRATVGKRHGDRHVAYRRCWPGGELLRELRVPRL